MPLLYELLGVDADATTPQVRAGFKRRAASSSASASGLGLTSFWTRSWRR